MLLIKMHCRRIVCISTHCTTTYRNSQKWCEEISSECTWLHFNALHCAALHCTVLYWTALNCTGVSKFALHALYRTLLHYTALHCTTLHCTALHCTALHCTALHCTALHCTALHYTALHCIALHRTFLLFTSPNWTVATNVSVTKVTFPAVSYCYSGGGRGGLVGIRWYRKSTWKIQQKLM